MLLTSDDLRIIFDALTDKYGSGYSEVPEVGRLQAKLSIMAEVVARTSPAPAEET